MNCLKWILKPWFWSCIFTIDVHILESKSLWNLNSIFNSSFVGYWSNKLIESLKWRSSLIPFLERIFQWFICAFINLKFTGGLYVTGKGSINEILSQFESCFNWGNGAFVSIISCQSGNVSSLNIEIETQIWNCSLIKFWENYIRNKIYHRKNWSTKV